MYIHTYVYVHMYIAVPGSASSALRAAPPPNPAWAEAYVIYAIAIQRVGGCICL